MRMCVVMCALALLSYVEAGPDETKEPPQLLVLELVGDGGAERGREWPVQIDKPFDVVIGGHKVTMRLRARAHRVFESAGVRFQYPRPFTFEFEQDGGLASWTLEGPNTVLMLHRYPKQNAAKLLASLEAEMAQSVGKGTKRGSTALKTRERELKGRRLDFELAGEAIRWDLFGFDAGGATYVLIVQDSMTDEGKPTADTRAAVALLRKTLTLK